MTITQPTGQQKAIYVVCESCNYLTSDQKQVLQQDWLVDVCEECFDRVLGGN